ncbi:TetR/AcrR family transcriptional regulator [Rhodococcus marinonascens]|uniref:TetR/AcrR family transcriptional regulator n=1 Tax=Rhodococcus marinonascens TaxID=38311 RepID=UPI0009322516|nr:TetR/AcrR family transcriptional regulator [Rhodococcus marinonascens]
MTSEIGLRDRKKAATRAALSTAAARLARVSGIESVTADAIASEVGVSPRTFHNYFSSKEEAVLAHFEESVYDWVNLLRARPSDEPIWDSLEHVVVQIVTDGTRSLEETAAIMELVESSPALLAKKLEVHLRVTRLIGEVIAERTGTDIDTDLYPNLLHTVVGAACRASFDLWMGGKSGASGPEELVRGAMRQLRQGLPQP